MSLFMDEYDAYLLWKYGEIEEEDAPYDDYEPDPDEGETTDEDTDLLGFCAIDIHDLE